VLCVSHMPASPPSCGAQARVHGLLTQLARHHDVTAVMLADHEFDVDECQRAMQTYCSQVLLIRNAGGSESRKRRLQLRSLSSSRSFERMRLTVPALQPALDRVLRARRFDIVNLEFPYLGHCNLRQAPPGARVPRLIVDSHEMAHDLARQFARAGGSLSRRVYGEINWRKLQREELATYRKADGVYLCSADDQRRLHDHIPHVPSVVIPNAADLDHYRPRATDPAPDARTVLYFGLLSTVPNNDAVTYFMQHIWPRIAEAHPQARCKIVGGRPSASLLAFAGPRIELTGFVPDLRPHLASAAAVVVPLRLGGGTRLKIVEAMAMGKAIVSTSLGAEGIEAVSGRNILVEDEPGEFAAAVNRLLAKPELAARIGQSARQLALEKYGWSGAAQRLEQFYWKILGRPQ
jgi:glycosyltransferase involved in cell wall biosynthesis